MRRRRNSDRTLAASPDASALDSGACTDARLAEPAAARRITIRRRELLRGMALSLLSVPSGFRVASAAAAEPVRVVLDVFENPPLICGNGTAIDPAMPGLTIQMLRMASEQTGVPIELSRTPWQRGLYLIETGQADAIFAASFVKERQRYGVYPFKDGRPDTTRKLFDQSYRLFIRGESEIGWDGETVTNLRAPVGATPGYAVVPELRARGVEVAEEPDHAANLRKLVAGRLDAYAELDSQIRPLLRNNKAEFGGVFGLSPPILTKPYYLMFSKMFYSRTPEIAERIWDAIAMVNSSPAYQELLVGDTCAD